MSSMTRAATPQTGPFGRPVRVPRDRIARGDCIRMLQQLPPGSVDMVLTDPPYICRYHARDGRTVANDDNDQWLVPAFEQVHRALKDGGFAVSFYGWTAVEKFVSAWRHIGLHPVGHIVFHKHYASSTRFLRYEHEQAFLLAKGRPSLPEHTIADVIEWPRYTGNRRHPTEKPVEILRPLVETFSRPGDIILDPFCGSGSTLEAARMAGRSFLGVEMDPQHHRTACERMGLAS